MIEFTVAIVRLHDLLNNFVAHVLLLGGTACCPCSLVACSILLADVYQHKLVREKVKVGIYPEQHSPRRRQSIVAGAKLCLLLMLVQDLENRQKSLNSFQQS